MELEKKPDYKWRYPNLVKALSPIKRQITNMLDENEVRFLRWSMYVRGIGYSQNVIWGGLTLMNVLSPTQALAAAGVINALGASFTLSTNFYYGINSESKLRQFVREVRRDPVGGFRRIRRVVLDWSDPDYSVRLPKEFNSVIECMYDPEMGPGRRLIQYV